MTDKTQAPKSKAPQKAKKKVKKNKKRKLSLSAEHPVPEKRLLVESKGTAPSDHEGRTPTPPAVPNISAHEVRPQKMEMEDVTFGQSNASELSPLLMQTGSVDKLLGTSGNTWPTLAQKLKKIFLPLQKKDSDPSKYIAELCTIYYTPQEGRETRYLIDDPEIIDEKDIKETADFVEKFMEANGQLAYIQKQDWFKSGDYRVGIDVNYYPDRSGYQESPIFHKDSGGNNIFVNLIFDNQKPIEATEWYPDAAQPSSARAELQSELLPADYLTDLQRARAAITDDQPVRGGPSEYVNTYVSWVDDLVWHATPAAVPRIEYSAAAAKTGYRDLNRAARNTDDDFEYDSTQFNRKMYGGEILGTIAETKGTSLHSWLQEKNLTAQDLDTGLALEAWQALYGSNAKNGRQNFLADAKLREDAGKKAGGWRITGSSSEATAHDDRLGKDDYSIRETPIGLSSRRRVNSLNGAEMAKIREANKDDERSFLRTWVRVLDIKDADEHLG
ncbi:hypothetical protein [Actinophytocola sp.]|uniref:hypothetical protein n=1 Tax=Actinophytocola sp. TaxID=1872138 RepID=UPI00389A8068